MVEFGYRSSGKEQEEGGGWRDSVDRGCGWGSRLASLVGVGDYEMAEWERGRGRWWRMEGREEGRWTEVESRGLAHSAAPAAREQTRGAKD